MDLFFLPEWLSGDLSRAIGQTLFHSLWQGAVVAVLASVILMATWQCRPGVRYWLLTGLFGATLITILITFCHSYTSRRLAGFQPETMVLQSVGSSKGNDSYASPLITNSSTAFDDQLNEFIDRYAPIIVMIWFAFFLFKCLGIMKGLVYVRRLHTVDAHPVSEKWREIVQGLRRKLGIKREVWLLESKLVASPVLLDYMKAVIVVPAGMMMRLPFDQVESVLLHELAHIRRRDSFVNGIQVIAESLFFFNPAILWLSSLMRQEREASCDELVVKNIPEHKSYIHALIHFQEEKIRHEQFVFALTGEKYLLLNRVKRLMNEEGYRLDRSGKALSVIGILVIFAFFAFSAKVTSPNADIPSWVNKSRKSLETELQIKNHPIVDTPPVKTIYKAGRISKSEFVSLQYDKSNDPDDRLQSFEVMDNTGKRVRIQKDGGDVVSLVINGVAIESSQISEYKKLLEAIDRFIAEGYARKQRAILEERQKIKDKNAVRIPGKKTLPVVVTGKPLPPSEQRQDKWREDAERVKAVLADLVKEGQVGEISLVDWFGINNSKMMVNGKSVPEDVYQRMKVKYNIREGMGLYYGPSQMHGAGVYFDKQDLD